MSSAPASRPKILFICAHNISRSFTAERMFAGSPLYDVKSRGIAREARIRLTARDLGWADQIFVMEKEHKDRIMQEHREALGDKNVVCLFIDDIYQPMSPELVAVLRARLEPYLTLPAPPAG
jgi:protein-tyrosine phosphatase